MGDHHRGACRYGSRGLTWHCLPSSPAGCSAPRCRVVREPSLSVVCAQPPPGFSAADVSSPWWDEECPRSAPRLLPYTRPVPRGLNEGSVSLAYSPSPTSGFAMRTPLGLRPTGLCTERFRQWLPGECERGDEGPAESPVARQPPTAPTDVRIADACRNTSLSRRRPPAVCCCWLLPVTHDLQGLQMRPVAPQGEHGIMAPMVLRGSSSWQSMPAILVGVEARRPRVSSSWLTEKMLGPAA